MEMSRESSTNGGISGNNLMNNIYRESSNGSNRPSAGKYYLNNNNIGVNNGRDSY